MGSKGECVRHCTCSLHDPRFSYCVIAVVIVAIVAIFLPLIHYTEMRAKRQQWLTCFPIIQDIGVFLGTKKNP